MQSHGFTPHPRKRKKHSCRTCGDVFSDEKEAEFDNTMWEQEESDKVNTENEVDGKDHKY